MPRGDGTGPNGMGPMTGRAAGYCAGYSTPGYMNPAGGRGMAWGRGGGFGRGMGWGRGRGFGRGMGWGGGFAPANYAPAPPAYTQPPVAPYTTEDEKTMLQNDLKMMEQNIESIKSRLEELDKDSKE